MVKAILEGRKTQTRRIIKSRTGFFEVGKSRQTGEVVFVCAMNDAGQWEYDMSCPYGKVGDVLWVRETWVSGSNYTDCGIGCEYGCNCPNWLYKASCEATDEITWKPSIHMPRSAARIFLEITDIKVERLRDISEEDAKAEGVEQNRDGSWHDYLEPNRLWQDDARASFQSLWLLINGEQSWQSNPWAWCITFKILSTTGKPENIIV